MLSTNTTFAPYLRILQALFVGFVVGLFALMLILIPFGSFEEDVFFQPIPALLTGIVYYSSLLTFSYLLLRPKILKQGFEWRLFLKIFVLFTFFFITIDVLSTWIKFPSVSEPIFDDQLQQNPGIFFLTVVLVSPIFEELIFRGAILSYLITHSTKVQALLFSSFLFGLIHFSLDQIVWGSIAGIFLGYAYMKSKNIIVPIFFHVLNNGIYFFLKFYGDVSSVFELFNL